MREYQLLNHLPPRWRLYRQLNHPTTIKHFPQGLLWTKYLQKMRDYRLLNYLTLRCRFYRLLNHPSCDNLVTNGKSAKKTRKYRPLNHLPLRWRLYRLLNHPPREHPATNGKSAETPGTRREIWQMRDMRSNLTLYHPQP